MEKTENAIDLKKLWWVFKKYILWILIIAVLGAVGAGVLTKLTSEVTYTTSSTFTVDVRDTTGNSSSATTEYYEIQKAKENAQELVHILGMNTTIFEAMKNGRLGDEDGPTLEQVNTVKESVVIVLNNEDLPLITVQVTTTSPDKCIQYARVLEEQLPKLFEKGNLFEQKNVRLTAVDMVDNKYVIPSDNSADPTAEDYNVPQNAPPVLRNIVLGGGAFLVMAYLAFFVFDMLDNTIRSSEALRSRFPATPVLGMIPQWSNKHLTRRQKRLERRGKLRDYDNKLLTKTTSFSVSESFRGLRTNISYVVGGKSTVIGVTSAKSGECKSVVSSNLAISYSQLQKKVLLVEGDMRLPAIHDIFNVTPRTGLPEVLAGLEGDYRNCVIQVNEYFGILPVGAKRPPNPAELLASDAMIELFDKLREEYDLIILDLPPIGTVSDASIVSKVVDQYLISTRAESSNAKNVEHVLRDMERLGMKVCGFVINGVTDGVGYAQSAYYYEGYGHHQKKEVVAEASDESGDDPVVDTADKQ